MSSLHTRVNKPNSIFLINNLSNKLTFFIAANIITLIKKSSVDSFLETFDEFVDDLLSSDVNLLKSELDFLIIQHLFDSVDLELIKNTEIDNTDSIAA